MTIGLFALTPGALLSEGVENDGLQRQSALAVGRSLLGAWLAYARFLQLFAEPWAWAAALDIRLLESTEGREAARSDGASSMNHVSLKSGHGQTEGHALRAGGAGLPRRARGGRHSHRWRGAAVCLRDGDASGAFAVASVGHSRNARPIVTDVA